MTLHDEIARLTQEKIAGSPLFLVEVKVSPNKVTVYLDHPKGVGIEDCVAVSRHLQSAFDGTPVFDVKPYLPYAEAFPEGTPCLDALMGQLAEMGFDPEVEGGPGGVTVGFTHCPFRDLAEANPDLVCGLHRGMVEGLVDTLGDDEVAEFHSLVHRSPCQVELVGAADTTTPSAETHLTDRMDP